MELSFLLTLTYTGVYLGPYQISDPTFSKLSTIFVKNFTMDALQGPKYVSVYVYLFV